jgi:uncharacterized membrane protein
MSETTSVEALGKLMGGSVGRYLSRDIAAIRDSWIHSSSASLRRRRSIVGISVLGVVNAAAMTLRQTGIIQRLPDIPIFPFNANRVTSSKKAFEFSMPDAPGAATVYSLIMVLATYGGVRSLKRPPWLDTFLLGVCLLNAAAGIQYFINMAFKQKRICLYCVIAALSNVSMVPPAWREWKQG